MHMKVGDEIKIKLKNRQEREPSAIETMLANVKIEALWANNRNSLLEEERNIKQENIIHIISYFKY